MISCGSTYQYEILISDHLIFKSRMPVSANTKANITEIFSLNNEAMWQGNLMLQDPLFPTCTQSHSSEQARSFTAPSGLPPYCTVGMYVGRQLDKPSQSLLSKSHLTVPCNIPFHIAKYKPVCQVTTRDDKFILISGVQCAGFFHV